MSESPPASRPEVIVEVKFDVSTPEYPFVSLSMEEDCRVELTKMLPRADGKYAEYFSVTGADPDDAVAFAADEDPVEPRLLTRYDAGGLVEFVVSDACPAWSLAKRGAIPTSVTGTAEGGTIVAEIFPEDDPSAIVADVVEAHDLELVAKRERSGATPLFSEQEIQQAVLERLTDRQREVLYAAYEAGYYDRPRETTGEELAEELGISPATFQQHIRAAERKVVALIADDGQ